MINRYQATNGVLVKQALFKRDTRIVIASLSLVHAEKEPEGKQHGKERTPAIGKQRRRQSRHRKQADIHPDIDGDLGKKHHQDPDGHHIPEIIRGEIPDTLDAVQERQIQSDDEKRADKPEFFGDDREDEIRMLFGEEN